MKIIELTRGLRATVDDSDFDHLSVRKWYAASCSKKGHFYAAARIDGSIVYMHRLLAAPLAKQHVDHINHDTLDNRRVNLRAVSASENLANSQLSKANKSGFKGVYYSKERAKWIAQARIGKRTVSIGGFITAQEAAAAYDATVFQQHGVNALTNKMLGLL